MIDPDAKVGLFTRIYDWLFYRPWTDEELAARVALSVANSCYRSWHGPEVPTRPPVTGRVCHSFTEIFYDGDEWVREQSQKRHDGRDLVASLPQPAPTKRFIYGENWNAYQKLKGSP